MRNKGRDISKLVSGSSFCVKPWVHCHVTTTGDVGACAISPVQFGNLRRQTLIQIWHGEPIQRFRAAHLSGEKVQGCEHCYVLEAVGAASLRQAANARFAEHAKDWIEETSESGDAPLARPIDYDIRFSNICNFKCRSCHHAASSSWFVDQVALNGRTAGPKAIIRAFDSSAEFWSAFGGFIDDVDQIYFAGGEPLLQDEHYQILEALRARGRVDVRISYNTNFSVLRHRGVDVTELWRNFTNVHVEASLDASGARAELLRHGQEWRTVLENRERLRQQCPHARFSVSCTVGALNVWHVPDFHRELVDTGFIAADEFDLNPLQEPPFMSAQVLPTPLKREVEVKIVAHLEWLRKRGEAGMAARFEALLQYLWAEDKSSLCATLRDVALKLDGLRGEDTRRVLPELASVLRDGPS